jgi:pyrroline-5-carboxylate reductase
MASALARGLGVPVLVSDIEADRALALARDTGGEIATNRGLAEQADVIFLCHKPDQLDEVASEIAGTAAGKAIVSILGGVPLASLQAAYPDRPVVRLMPNVAVEAGRGVICISPAPDVPADLRGALVELLGRAATVVPLEEKLMEAATAAMGCSPAYVAYVVEAQVDAAVRLGLPPEVASVLVNETTAGTAELIKRRGYDTLGVRRMVTSPGGSTARGLAALDAGGVRAAFQEAADAVVHGGRR